MIPLGRPGQRRYGTWAGDPAGRAEDRCIERPKKREKTMTKIGDKLWTHPYGRPECWVDAPVEITGETKQSWLLGDPNFKRNKVNKKTMQESVPGFTPRQWYTLQDKIDVAFLHAHRHQISAAVLSEKNVQALKTIAGILGMELK